jgi:hypothetical protein
MLLLLLFVLSALLQRTENKLLYSVFLFVIDYCGSYSLTSKGEYTFKM